MPRKTSQSNTKAVKRIFTNALSNNIIEVVISPLFIHYSLCSKLNSMLSAHVMITNSNGHSPPHQQHKFHIKNEKTCSVQENSSKTDSCKRQSLDSNTDLTDFKVCAISISRFCLSKYKDSVSKSLISSLQLDE